MKKFIILKLHALGRWLCTNGYHDFSEYTRSTRKTVYYMRECLSCNKTERQQAGPAGDGSWQGEAKPFKYEWEKEEYDKSSRD